MDLNGRRHRIGGVEGKSLRLGIDRLEGGNTCNGAEAPLVSAELVYVAVVGFIAR